MIPSASMAACGAQLAAVCAKAAQVAADSCSYAEGPRRSCGLSGGIPQCASTQVSRFQAAAQKICHMHLLCRSVLEGSIRNTSTLSVKMLSRAGAKGGAGQVIRCTLPYIRADVPIFIVFRALGGDVSCQHPWPACTWDSQMLQGVMHGAGAHCVSSWLCWSDLHSSEQPRELHSCSARVPEVEWTSVPACIRFLLEQSHDGPLGTRCLSAKCTLLLLHAPASPGTALLEVL